MNKYQGFTLLEVLVVVLIIGIILSFATLSIGDGGQAAQLEQEANRLNALLILASQQAVMHNQELGVAFDQQGYQFYKLQAKKWQLIQQDEILRPRPFPVGIQVELSVEGAPISFTNTHDVPQLLLLSSGEFTPFSVTMTVDAKLSYNLVGTMNGVIKLNRDNSL